MFTHIHFQTLPVTDMARALAFYRDIMGFEVERDNPYGESRWIFMRIPGARTLLHFGQVDHVEQGETPTLILATDDVDATCDKLRGRGATIAREPADAPWEPGTRWAYVNDSEGNLVLVQTIKKDPADG
jgi:predicted enzyme related to lactoylglutathione lyase